MFTLKRLAGTLLLSTALVHPSLARAQDAPPTATTTPSEPADPAEQADEPSQPPAGEDAEISIPGGDIVVTGRRSLDVTRESDQILTVLTSEAIAKTGEGNIASSLSRVTGLSVVGSGYVYVRGLGERYSLALLNGSPLPSPEPLKRVVPLDLFPTGLIGSALVQKSYSVNYPGEFGGGVINLTTKSIPKETFLTVGAGGAFDTITSGKLGYTYYGAKSDWTGFDNGTRDVPPLLDDYFNGSTPISSGDIDTNAIAQQLITPGNSLAQRNKNIPWNWSGSFSGGTKFDLGGARLGLILGGGYSNKWITRDIHQQRSLNSDLSSIETDFRRVTTDNRVVVNGLAGLGLEFGEHLIRWTNVYIHDTDKQTRLGLGRREDNPSDLMQQDTAYFERQLIDTQLVGEFKLTDALSLDVRGGYANTKRKAPDQIFFEYVRSNSDADPYGHLFVNRLNNGNGGDARITFSDLKEDLWSAGADLSYKLAQGYTVTVGGAWTDQDRLNSRRSLSFLAGPDFDPAFSVLRPDILLSPGVIDYTGTTLVDTTEGSPTFRGTLTTKAGYAKLNADFTDQLSLDVGVRYEKGQLEVAAVPVFGNTFTAANNRENNSYWLPAATLTYKVTPRTQLRFSASKTIARPQFRELLYQGYYDPETSRLYQGNPLITDSKLTNFEARAEHYLGREERISVAGFYKNIDKPIESFLSGADFITTFANAPKARLYGGEFELQNYFNFADMGMADGFFGDRRIVSVVNYTYSKSKLIVRDGDISPLFGAFDNASSTYFQDGAPMTGQSDHLLNLELGLEHRNRLSQQTFLISYASDRAISRGLYGSPPQPDVVEKPGLRLDFVAREGLDLFGKKVELKFEARNLTGRKHIEEQRFEDRKIDVNTYDVGRTYGLSGSVTF